MRRIAQPLRGPPGTGYHRLSQAKHQLLYAELIAPTYLRRPVARDNPVVVYLVGEPGTDTLQAGWLVKRAMRPGAIRLDPEKLRGVHPDYYQLLIDEPRTAAEAVCADSRAWMAQAQTYLRGLHADMLIDADFDSGEDFLDSARRDQRAGYRVEVVALAARATDSRQRTAVHYARAAQLDLHAPFPTAAAHQSIFRAGAEIVAAAETSTIVSAVTIVDRGHQALHRHQAGQKPGWASWALAAERHRLYSEQEASRFLAVDRALAAALPYRIPHRQPAAGAHAVRLGAP
ncbi:zeta toxin family protein [Streptomyces sp. NPDC059564]|uniref:zeta toxin family protein n=1 Tax=Streptomyces sp. NPDC059564 TaxID=3346865 RepID=UPI0036C8D573